MYINKEEQSWFGTQKLEKYPSLKTGKTILEQYQKSLIERLEKRYKKRSELMDKAKGDIQKMMELTGRFMGEDMEEVWTTAPSRQR